MSTQARSWCITVNNPTEDFFIWNEDEDGGISDLRYAIYQRERGESGTEHIQGYLEFNKPKRLTWLKGVPGLASAHCEPRRGTREQAADYCRKEETRISGPIEFGDFR